MRLETELSELMSVIGGICEFNVHNAESISLCDATFFASGSSENNGNRESQNVERNLSKVPFCDDS